MTRGAEAAAGARDRLGRKIAFERSGEALWVDEEIDTGAFPVGAPSARTGRSGWPRGYLSRNVNKPISPLPTIRMAGLMRVRTSNPNTATATKAVSQPVTAPFATVREPDKSSPIATGARPR